MPCDVNKNYLFVIGYTGTLLSQTNLLHTMRLTYGRQLSLLAQPEQYPDHSLSASGHSAATSNKDQTLCTVLRPATLVCSIMYHT